MTTSGESANSDARRVYHKSFFGELSHSREICIALDEFDFVEEDLRTSRRLHRLIHAVISHLNDRRVLVNWGEQFVTTRFDSITHLLVHSICVPSVYQIGHRLSRGFTGWFSSSSSSTTDPHSSSSYAHTETPLVIRAKGIILEAFTVVCITEEMLASHPNWIFSDRQSNKDRQVEDGVVSIDEVLNRICLLFLNLLDFQSSWLLQPIELSLRSFGAEALECLSCYLLSTTATCESITNAIQDVIGHFRNILHGSNAGRQLGPNLKSLVHLLRSYFDFLWLHRADLVSSSRKDEILRSLSSNLRLQIRSEPCQSHSDFVFRYNTEWKAQLTHITVPLQPFVQESLEQAAKDLKREEVSINKIIYRPGNPLNLQPSEQPVRCEAWEVLREEIRKVLVFVFEIDSPDAFDEPNSSSASLSRTVSSSNPPSLTIESKSYEGDSKYLSDEKTAMNVSNNAQASSLPSANHSFSEGSTSNSSSIGTAALLESFAGTDTKAFLRRISSTTRSGSIGSEEDGDEVDEIPPHYILHYLLPLRTSPTSTNELPTNDCTHSLSPSPQLLKNISSSWFRSACRDVLRLVHQYTVLAASRTFSGGDAFILLNDLFVGEGLFLSPIPRNVRSQSPNLLKSPNRDLPLTPDRLPHSVDYSSSDSHATLPLSSGVSNTQCDVTVAITSSGIKVVLKERYRLLSAQSLDFCSDESLTVPLCCFECTTTNLIVLSQPFLAELPPAQRLDKIRTLLITQPERIVLRAVSIEPIPN